MSFTDSVGDEFAQALRQFDALLDRKLLDALQPSGPNAVYTTAVVVLLLIYQRLRGNASLGLAVSQYMDALQGSSCNRRVTEGTLSANTAGYSRARSRLEVKTAERVCDLMYEKLTATTEPSYAGRRVYILDGTTVTLPPEPALKRAFPPAPNQHGASHWPVCHLLMAHELASGCALRPEIGAMYGPERVGELTLAVRLLPRLPPHSVLLADRNFGVFAYVFAAVTGGHDVLVRMTEKRFQSLRRSATPCGPGEWTLLWKPSRWDRSSHPELPDEACVPIRLHEVQVRDNLTLWLVTTLTGSGAEWAALYGRRLDVETDIRDIKTTLQVDRMTSRSVSMMYKEVTLAIVAYNLVVQVRRLAAQQAGVPPRRLSFSGTWSLLTTMLLRQPEHNAAQWRKRFECVLRGAAQRKIPRRPGRSYPRTVLPRRRKFPERPPDPYKSKPK